MCVCVYVWRGMKETRLPGKQNTIMSSHGPRDVSLTADYRNLNYYFPQTGKRHSSGKRRVSLKKELAKC